MARTINRRKFLRIAITSSVSASLGGCAANNINIPPSATPVVQHGPTVELGPGKAAVADDDITAIMTLLRRTFHYLNVDESAFMTFALNFQSKAEKKVLDQRQNSPDQFEYTVSTQFLLSTDFFWNGTNESLPVQYRTYYDPYNGCTSPFARFDEDYTP